MRTLPVEDQTGRIIGALMLEDEHNNMLQALGSMELSGIFTNHTSSGKVKGYVIRPAPVEE